MTFILNCLIGVGLIAVLFALRSRFASFRAQAPEDYIAGPMFDIRERLNGPIQCEGVIYGPLGRVTSRFTAEFDAYWDGNVGRMSETFHYDSGTIQNREWTLRLSNDGGIKAEAADLVGVGSGQQMGSAVVLNYRIELTADAGGHVLDATDWMYLMDNGTVMNRTQFRKFGIKVAELVATMRPRDVAMAAE